MTTEEVANRIIELFNEGKSVQAEQETYAEDVISHEQDGRTEKGLEAIIAKTKAAGAMFETLHKAEVAKKFINQDTFLLVFEMDATFKGGNRMQMTEYGFYRVADGKVVEEYFYAM